MIPPSCSITLEEHTAFPSLGDYCLLYEHTWDNFPEARDGLKEHSLKRVAEMDEGHVSYQVISHLPGIVSDDIEAYRKANNEMAEAIKKHPDRLGGFAALPMAYPELAAVELERAVRELGFVGAMIDNHLQDMTHYDNERFWIVFEAAERLDVPIYIHPAPPSAAEMKARFEGNYSSNVAMGLGTALWGWHENVGLHIIKLFVAGLFKRYPKLKIIIGHMGEGIPMMIDRLDSVRLTTVNGLGKFSEVWERNIWVTSSGIFSVRALEMLLKVTQNDHVLYSVDTPFCKSNQGWKFLQELAEKGSLSQEDLDMFAYGNAKRLLKLGTSLKRFE
ncbi:amidohydrolase 2 [Camillea tinctor]|nr:amidohydrolase 2 [Camillea tinctor]